MTDPGSTPKPDTQNFESRDFDDRDSREVQEIIETGDAITIPGQFKIRLRAGLQSRWPKELGGSAEREATPAASVEEEHE